MATPANDSEKDETRIFPSGQKALFTNSEKLAQVPREVTRIKIEQVEVYKIFHLREYLNDLPKIPNRFLRSRMSSLKLGVEPPVFDWQHISDEEVVLADSARIPKTTKALGFMRAGARKEIVWQLGEVKAAIVTCGGLCPGLNDVVEEIVKTLYYNYGVDDIYGIRDGYRGFYEEQYQAKSWSRITPEDVEDVHRSGGTCLGSTRGGFHLEKIMNALITRGINHVYIIGGDGSHRAADIIFRECWKRKLKIVVVGVPKTIDNDIGVIDRSFGFYTAIEEAQKAIISARIEASCTLNGIGIVKLMGRESGMIAAHATAASREVDLCLIPEVPFVLDGPNGILKYLEGVLETQGHAVIVVSEGAGGDLVEKSPKTDPSGNKVLPEIGLFLRKRIKEHFE